MTTTGIDPWGRVTGQRAFDVLRMARARPGRVMPQWTDLFQEEKDAWAAMEMAILDAGRNDAADKQRNVARLVRCTAIRTLVQAAESPASVPPHVVSAASVLLNADDKDLAAVALDMEFVKKLEARIHPMQTLDVKPKETA